MTELNVGALKIGLIGFGEVGKTLAKGLREHNLAWLGTWDILLNDPVHGPAMNEYARAARVTAVATSAELLAHADLVISAVTAANDIDVAADVAKSIRPGTFFLDFNSCSPGAKMESARHIDGAAGRYVEAAVMAPIGPYGIRVPMLLGGEYAGQLDGILGVLGFNAKVVAAKIGVASAIKMCRSIVIKGMEAILVDSFSTARRYGVEDYVIASLRETYPQMDWDKEGAYFFERVTTHGKRRAEEMREVAVTVREAGFEPWISSATADKQDWVASIARKGAFKGLPKDASWRDYADRLNAAVPLDSKRKTA